MEIKEVLLESEKQKVESFLDFFNLKLSQVEKTFYIEENEKIVGTVSTYRSIVKCFAVDPSFQGDNVSGMLISNVISFFQSRGITSYQVYTKPIYKDKFKSFGFREVISTDKVTLLEGGATRITDEIEKIKVGLKYRFTEITEDSDIACVIANANPVTNGHMALIEKASKEHQMVVVFVVEEDESFFSFKERMSLMYLACKRLDNVYVMPSTKYIVSLATFPSYFLKDNEEVAKECALVDALIYKNYFEKEIYFKKRYVGSEEDTTMVIYNNTLKEVLSDTLEVVDRFKQDNRAVSAKTVRMLLNYNMFDEAMELMPRETYSVMSLMRDRWKEN